jgi:hypothetical protein
MAKLSKRAQVEALGWTFTAIPHFWEAGTMWHCPETGRQSAERWDYKHPDGWTVTPPAGFPASPRRVDTRSPNPAVRWAYDQAMAPRLKPELGGVAGLVALMGEARRAGVVADGVDVGCILPVRPDAELLALCGEMMGAGRVVDNFRSNAAPCPWTEKSAHERVMSSFGEACRTMDRLLPRVVEVPATTAAGVVAKARVVERAFGSPRGAKAKADAVRSLVADMVTLLQPGADGVAS